MLSSWSRAVSRPLYASASKAVRSSVDRQAALHVMARRQTAASPRSSRFQSASKSTVAEKPHSGKGGFVEWYEGHLESQPVITKMLTGCFLWGIGDVVAQIVPQAAAAYQDGDKKASNKPLDYDWPRTGRAVLFGFALHAPTSHLHFNFLEWLTNKVGVTGYGIPIFKAFMEQFVYWGWISNGMYLGAMGMMQGQPPKKIYDKIHDNLWELMKAQWGFWVPIQLLNFQFIPVRHQLNVVLVTSVVWTALLSFWYPPETKVTLKRAVTTLVKPLPEETATE